MKRFTLLFAGMVVGLLGMPSHATSTVQPFVLPSIVTVSSTTAAAGTATVTISSPVATTYSLGLYTYITNIHIEMYATGTLTGGATPVSCTTTNLSSLVWKMPTAAATGTTTVVDMQFTNPLLAPNSAINTVITCPATASVIWNVTVGYYQAP